MNSMECIKKGCKYVEHTIFCGRLIIVCAECGISISTMMDCPLENPFPEPIKRGVLCSCQPETQERKVIEKVLKEAKIVEVKEKQVKLSKIEKLQGLKKLYTKLTEDNRKKGSEENV